MADNITLNAMSGGSVVRTNDIGSGIQVEYVKLMDGTSGSSAVIPGDATSGLFVQVKTVAAGSNFIGYVGTSQKTVSPTFNRPANTTAYAAGQQVSNSTTAPTVITFSSVARANGGSGIIIGAVLVDEANQTTKGQFELWMFDTTVTPNNDGSAFAPTNAFVETAIGIIPFNSVYVGNTAGNCIYPVQGLNIPFTCGVSVPDIYGLLVVRNAYTPVSAEKFTFRLTVVQN